MRTPNPREKRFIQYAAIGIAIYLAVWYGSIGVSKLNARRAEYQKLVAQAKGLKTEIAPYVDKAAATTKLMQAAHLDPARLNRATLVTEVSSALQRAATAGIQLGPVREIPNRGSGKELSTIQFEATGPLPPLLNLLGSVDTLGFPLVIDAVQFSGNAQQPGPLKLSLTIVILDYEKWKPSEAPHA